MQGTGEVVMVRADGLRPGDTFGTDGGVVTDACLLLGGGVPDEVAVQVLCHGIDKFAYLSPDHACPIWRVNTGEEN